MDVGDLVRCWAIHAYNKIGILLEHDRLLKQVKVFFQDSGEIQILYSRDIEVLKRTPGNKRKFRKKILDND